MSFLVLFSICLQTLVPYEQAGYVCLLWQLLHKSTNAFY